MVNKYDLKFKLFATRDSIQCALSVGILILDGVAPENISFNGFFIITKPIFFSRSIGTY